MTSTTPAVRPAFQGRSLPEHSAIIPARPGWTAMLGPHFDNEIPVIGWHVSGAGTEAVTVYGRHARAVLCHRNMVYHPDGRCESREDYERRTYAEFSAARAAQAGRA